MSDSIVIGTGGVTGVYYPSGGAICQMVNRLKGELGISCARESTKGSVYNINTIRSGGLDVGIAQSDWQYHAYRGTDRFQEDGAFTDLRALFSLHSEPFTVVARADAGIRVFEDLRGKRVNVGTPGSGQRATLELLMGELGWDMGAFAEALEIEPSEQSNALCSNEIDAFVYTVGHPSSAIQEAMSTCDSVLVEVSGPAIDNLIKSRPYYATAVIPAGLYRNHDKDVATFGVKATVVTSRSLKESTAYRLVTSVFENLTRMRRMHPSFSTLEAGN
ncbi:MAG: C4-dicarboxylate ABC transporter substrate-binding protein, partial [Proteobacteria bacterium]